MSHLKKIITRAKSLKRQYPNTAWKNLVKRASSELRSEGAFGKSGIKKHTAKKKGSHKISRRKSAGSTVHHVTAHASHNHMPSEASLKATLRSVLKNKLSGKLLKKSLATTKRDRNKYSKEASTILRELKKIT
jgi:hypothetical protein